MYHLDEQERLIVRELIRDPRISDNQIAIKTNVPLKTVNRKRKIMEEKGYLKYFCYLDNSIEGTGLHQGRALFITVFREGITRQEVMEKLASKELPHLTKHLLFKYLGDFHGKAALAILMESNKEADLTEIYNAEIYKALESIFGKWCISQTLTMPVSATLRRLKNYTALNTANGTIKDSWTNDKIVVD